MKKKEYKNILSIMFLMIITIFIFGCDSEYCINKANALPKMTTSERIIFSNFEFYSQSVDGFFSWNIILDAIGKRKEPPTDRAIPFCDVANGIILVYNNTKNLKRVGDDKLQQAYPTDWMNNIKNCITDPSLITPKIPEVSAKLSEVKLEELIPYNEYSILLKEIDGCKSAENKIRTLFRDKRFLTVVDRDEIMKEVIYCKGVELESKVK